MRSLFRYVAGGAGVLLGAAYVAALSEADLSVFRPFAFETQSDAGMTVVNRAGKADRLSARREGDRNNVIATVEVIGAQDTAVVYRSRDGRILFQTDPLANATVVTKGITLPEVTIRNVSRPAPQQIPRAIDTVPASPQNPPSTTAHEPKILEGCDPAFSPLTAAARANFSGRCLAALTPPTRLAAALH